MRFSTLLDLDLLKNDSLISVISKMTAMFPLIEEPYFVDFLKTL
jgi:hypothetical protein